MVQISSFFRNILLALLLVIATLSLYQKSYAASPILTISGKITDNSIIFDINQLRAMPNFKIKTETIWTDGSHTYTAISIENLLTSIGAQGTQLKLTALNDYSIEVPINVLVENNAFIAFEKNGKKMRIRDKGPLWLLYPFTDSPQINTPFYQSHSVWQLKSIEVL